MLVEDLYGSVEAARWPMFAAAVAERTQVRALFALPLQWGLINLGVMDLYRLAAGGLSSAQYRDAITAADTAALMMLGQRTEPRPAHGADSADRDDHHLPEDDRSDDDGQGQWLEHAVSHRAEIHQATGMVLAQRRAVHGRSVRPAAPLCPHHLRLSDVARQVIDTGLAAAVLAGRTNPSRRPQ